MKRIVVFDTETADFERGGIVEIAAVELDLSGNITDFSTSLTNPGIPITPQAMAVHHISNEEIEDKDPIDDVLRNDLIYDMGGTLFLAHNMAFDIGVMPDWFIEDMLSLGGQTACTWKLAKHLYPDAPAYGNQVLRYYLDLDVSDMPAEAGGIVHRALYDTWCTAKMVQDMIQNQGMIPDEMPSLSKKPVLLKTVDFGKHKGKSWEEVARQDRGYLSWLIRNHDDQDVVHTARHWTGSLL